jgi:glutamate synthase (NADPH/NADH) small chain
MHQHNEKPIEIGRLQRFAMESYYNAGGKIPLRIRQELPQHVVCIGAGPASLSCAAELRQLGVQVTVLDRRPLPGGLNTYGVAEIEQIRALGVEFRTGEIAHPESLARLEREYDAIFLGVGLGAMHKLSIPGGEHSAVVDALEFIAAYKTGAPRMPGRAVVVIGAGNTAMDAAVAACRLGADNVRIVYRRGRENISAFDFEFEHASREGVHFVWNTLPLTLYPSAAKHGRHYLECVELRPDASGLLMPITNSEFRIACDLVIPAIGQAPLIELLAELRGVQLDRSRIAVDRASGRTSHPKYFAGGDCANGGREVVDAVADGKRAARGIAAAIAPAALAEAVHG